VKISQGERRENAMWRAMSGEYFVVSKVKVWV